jgi:hypothetical protein
MKKAPRLSNHKHTRLKNKLVHDKSIHDRSIHERLTRASLATISSLFFASGCTHFGYSPEFTSQSTHLEQVALATDNTDLKPGQGGSILIARPAPKITTRHFKESDFDTQTERMLAFSPLDNSALGDPFKRVPFIINRNQKKLRLANLTEESTSHKTLRVKNVKHSLPHPSGAYHVTLVQDAPRWYAPDSYFERRNISVPPAGSALRYLKGALGLGSIFLELGSNLATFAQNGIHNNNNSNASTPGSHVSFPIHCAKEYTEDVGGIQVSEKVFKKLKETVRAGNVVIIR